MSPFFPPLPLPICAASLIALASSLNNLASLYAELGRRKDALAPAEEAVEIRRALVARGPDA